MNAEEFVAGLGNIKLELLLPQMNRLQRDVPLEYPGKAYFVELGPLATSGIEIYEPKEPPPPPLTDEENNLLELLSSKIVSWKKKSSSKEDSKEIIEGIRVVSGNLAWKLFSLIGDNFPLMEAIHNDIATGMVLRTLQYFKEESYSQQRKNFIGSIIIGQIRHRYYNDNIQEIRMANPLVIKEDNDLLQLRQEESEKFYDLLLARLNLLDLPK